VCLYKNGKTQHFLSQGSNTVQWLGEEALRKYERLKPSTFEDGAVKNGVPDTEGPRKRHKVAEIRKTKGGAILDPHDTLIDVLDDNDFVSVGKLLSTSLCCFY
jgi:histidine ammonia-lyase